MSSVVEAVTKPVTGLLGVGQERRVADGASAEQMAQISAQQTQERRRLATETSDVERRKALLTRGGAGRSLLIRKTKTGGPGTSGKLRGNN